MNELKETVQAALEEQFASERSTFNVGSVRPPASKAALSGARKAAPESSTGLIDGQDDTPLFAEDSSDEDEGMQALKGDTTHGDEDSFGAPTLLIPQNVPESPPSPEELVPMQSTDQQPDTISFRGSARQGRTEPEHEDAAPPTASDSAVKRSMGPPLSPTVTQLATSAATTGLPPLCTTPESLTSITTNRNTAQPRADQPRSSIQEIQAPRASSSRSTRSETGQLVLSTLGTSWNLKPAASAPGDSSGDQRPRKRQRLDSDTDTLTTPTEAATNRKSVRRDFRVKIAGYAMAGSQVDGDPDGSDTDSDLTDDATRPTTGAVDDQAGDTVEVLGLPSTPDSVVEIVDPSSKIHDTPSHADIDDRSDTDGSVEILEAEAGDTHSPEDALSGTRVGIMSETNSQTSSEQEGSMAPEYVRTSVIESLPVHCDEDALCRRWSGLLVSSLTSSGASSLADKVEPSPCDVDDAAATDVLSRVIRKADFADMDIIGQFNLGFIIVRRASMTVAQANLDGPTGNVIPASDDLFIVDQHAADEKYNFEQLQETTRITSQTLFRSV